MAIICDLILPQKPKSKGKPPEEPLGLGKGNSCAASSVVDDADSSKSTHDQVEQQRPTTKPERERWTRPIPMTLTYALSPTHTINYIKQADIEATLRQAFKFWAKFILVDFEPAAEFDAADIKIGFYDEKHEKEHCTPFKDNELAHALWPENGSIHMNAAKRWSVDLDKERSRKAYYLLSVFVHEIGHVLGVGHSSRSESIMHPSVPASTEMRVELTEEEIEEIQAVYGRKLPPRIPWWERCLYAISMAICLILLVSLGSLIFIVIHYAWFGWKDEGEIDWRRRQVHAGMR